MAGKAEELLAGSGWLPEPLPTPGRILMSALSTSEPGVIPTTEPGEEETAAPGYETAMAETDSMAEDETDAADPHAAAAE